MVMVVVLLLNFIYSGFVGIGTVVKLYRCSGFEDTGVKK